MSTTTGLTATTRKALKSTVDGIRSRLLEELYVATERKFSFAAQDRSRLDLSPRIEREYARLELWTQDPLRADRGFEANVKALIKEVAYTLTNRLFILRQLEARRVHSLPILSGGRESAGYKEFAEFCPELCRGEDGGYRFLLQQRFDHMALDLPGFFAHNPLHEIVELPGPTLFWLIEQLNHSELEGAWTDDTTLGWLYQYWNDPDRTAVNNKVEGKGVKKGNVQANELAHATQLFTERYMVEWLLQNSLGTQWLAICQKRGWTPEAVSILESLETKRADWREKLSQGEVFEDMPMPIDNAAEERWKYYVQQDIPLDVIDAAPDSLKDVKVLDPACGSGHFLVYAFDLLYAFYQEEAQHSGQTIEPAEIVNQILSHNLHGIDIDPRAVQIAAAALLIKAQSVAPGFHPSRFNLVSTDLGLGKLDSRDPSIVRFQDKLTHAGIDPEMVNRLMDTLRGADYLGSLMQVEQVQNAESSLPLFQAHTELSFEDALQEFLQRHDAGEDLGVRTRAEQLAKGLRVIALLQQKYEVVCANPPYLGARKVEAKLMKQIAFGFPEAKADLYAIFIRRVQQLLKQHGFGAMITMHSWMFLSTYQQMREKVLNETTFKAIAHMGRGGGFLEWGDFDKVMQTTMFTFSNGVTQEQQDISCYRLNSYRNKVKDYMLLCQNNHFHFHQSKFQDIEGAPMIYWWPEEFREKYLVSGTVKNLGLTKVGLQTGNNDRFTLKLWEVYLKDIEIILQYKNSNLSIEKKWYPYLKGAAGKRWFETLTDIVNYEKIGKQLKFSQSARYGRGATHYFLQGIAINKIGTNDFFGRLRKYKSIFDVAATSIFLPDSGKSQVILSSKISGYVTQSINPTINNQAGDIDFLPILESIQNWKGFFIKAESLYDKAFASKETCIEYQYQDLDQENFEASEILIRSAIDNEIYAQFQPETVAAIKAEVGESPGNYPQLSESDLAQVHERYPDFADIYLNGPYKVEYGQKKLKKNGEPERGKLQSLEELCHEFQLHPESIIALRKHLGIQRKSDRQDEAYRHLAWALGVALGRFDAQTGGLVDLADERRGGEPVDENAPKALPHGMFMVSQRGQTESLHGDDPRQNQGLEAQLRAILAYKHGEAKTQELWDEIEAALVFDCKAKLTAKDRQKYNFNQFLRDNCFAFHNSVYEKRPIYFPLSSAKRNYVVWSNIHTWHDATLKTVLADFLMPEQRELTRRLDEMRIQKNAAAGKAHAELEDSIAQYQKWLDELEAMIALVQQIDQQGAHPAKQEQPNSFVMDLDDGVMINSAALWPLLHPQWKDPKKWWGHLEKPVGKNDYDWSHLAMRYWPQRCWDKLVKDPSLAVAHSDYGEFKGRDLFQELHPEMAAKWEAEQRKDS